MFKITSYGRTATKSVDLISKQKKNSRAALIFARVNKHQSQDSQDSTIFRFPAIFTSCKSHDHKEEGFRGNRGREGLG